MLLEGQDVGHQLAGMRLVGQPVDHRHAGRARKVEKALVALRAQHDPVDIARQHLRRVAHGLAMPELHVAPVEEHALSAQLAHAHVERDARARRGLLEHKRQHAPLERHVIIARTLRASPAGFLHAPRAVDQRSQGRRVKGIKIKEVPRRAGIHFAASFRG